MRPLVSHKVFRSVVASLAVTVLLCLGVLLTGCASGFEGSWTPEKGAVHFSANGYDWNMATEPAGGLIIVKDGSVYRVMLISANGRRVAVSATMRGSLLAVGGSGTLPLFYLGQSSPNRLDWLEDHEANGKPVKDPQIAFVPETPTSAPSP